MSEDNETTAYQRQWLLVEEHYRSGKPLTGKIIEAVPKSITIDVGGIQGFVEQPHYYYYTPDTAEEHKVSPEERFKRHLEQLQGQEMQLKVIEADRTRNHLLLSQHLDTEEERQDKLSRQVQRLREIQPGDIRSGIVTSLTNMSVSVDVEGVDGWLPRHFLSSQNPRVDPHEIVHIGQEIEVMVLENDRRRVTLSLIHAQQRDVILQTMQPGQILTAHVQSLSNEGVYVDLGGPIGFISANQIVHGYITHPADVLHSSQEVVVKLEHIDDNKRVVLSLIKAR